jgi:RNA polymerase sigma factor (sigma-70 family)
MGTQAETLSVGALDRFGFDDVPGLTAALKRGDEEAFRCLHRHWNTRLSRYCYALAAGDEALAADVVQATYLRTLRHIRELPDEAALWAWLLCAARSAAADSRKVNGRYRRALARFAEWLAPAKPAAAPEVEPMLVAALDRAVAELEPEDRALLDARYAEHESLATISERFGLTVRAVEGRMARLRERLRRAIAAQMRHSSIDP